MLEPFLKFYCIFMQITSLPQIYVQKYWKTKCKGSSTISIRLPEADGFGQLSDHDTEVLGCGGCAQLLGNHLTGQRRAQV